MLWTYGVFYSKDLLSRRDPNTTNTSLFSDISSWSIDYISLQLCAYYDINAKFQKLTDTSSGATRASYVRDCCSARCLDPRIHVLATISYLSAHCWGYEMEWEQRLKSLSFTLSESTVLTAPFDSWSCFLALLYFTDKNTAIAKLNKQSIKTMGLELYIII